MALSTPFVPFGAHHLIALAFVVMGSAAVIVLAGRIKNSNWERTVAWTLVLVVTGQELAKKWMLVTVYGFPWVEQLPFGLCSLNAFLCAVMLGARSYRLFEVAYFWSMAAPFRRSLRRTWSSGSPVPRSGCFLSAMGW